MIRLLLSHASSGRVTVDGPRLHYLSRVLRVTAGTSLEVFDGAGHCFDATVWALNPDAAVLELGPARAAPKSRQVTVVQGLPKADKLELIIQKGTELGASAFWPAACRRSVVKLDGKEDVKQTRWQRISEEAARQCGRADVPHVHRPTPLLEAAAGLTGAQLLVLDEAERSLPLSQALGASTQPLAIFIGPEGGLEREEVEALRARGAQSVTLGRSILRTETSALAALCVVRYLDGELG